MFSALGFLSLCSYSLASSPPSLFSSHSSIALNSIHTSSFDAHFYDDFGRVRLFHGLNAVAKEPPWYPYWLLNASLVEEIASLGINVIRLGWIYNGYQPSQNIFNHSYYEQFSEIVSLLAQYNIYSLLDVHQDCLSSKFCLYDAFPLWVINKSETPAHPYPWPYTKNCSSRSWTSNCLTDAASSSYQNLYDNYNGMRDDFGVFWQQTASVWKNNTNVLGYELMNEPFAGAIYKDPLLLIPGVAGARNLQPFYEQIAAAIRSTDPDHVLFYEPVTWGMVLNGTWTGTGFSHVPGGEAFKNRSCLSYHYYCESFGDILQLCDPIIAPSVFRSIAEEVKLIGGASMLTEWGECDHLKNISECVQVMNDADEFLQSWIEWGYYGQSSASPSLEFKLALSRTYAQAVAGVPINMSYVDATHEFRLCYHISLYISAPTVVFAAFGLHYPRGVSLSSTPNVLPKAFAADNQILITNNNETAKDGDIACFQLTAI